MLDFDGFVVICNLMYFFIVCDGEVWISLLEYCFGGIMCGNIICVCCENDILVFEKWFLLFDVYFVDEVFIIGMFVGIMFVCEVDGCVLVMMNGLVM